MFEKNNFDNSFDKRYILNPSNLIEFSPRDEIHGTSAGMKPRPGEPWNSENIRDSFFSFHRAGDFQVIVKNNRINIGSGNLIINNENIYTFDGEEYSLDDLANWPTTTETFERFALLIINYSGATLNFEWFVIVKDAASFELPDKNRKILGAVIIPANTNPDLTSYVFKETNYMDLKCLIGDFNKIAKTTESGAARSKKIIEADVNGKFENSNLYTGHGNGLDADTLDGFQATDLITKILFDTEWMWAPASEDTEPKTIVLPNFQFDYKIHRIEFYFRNNANPTYVSKVTRDIFNNGTDTGFTHWVKINGLDTEISTMQISSGYNLIFVDKTNKINGNQMRILVYEAQSKNVSSLVITEKPYPKYNGNFWEIKNTGTQGAWENVITERNVLIGKKDNGLITGDYSIFSPKKLFFETASWSIPSAADGIMFLLSCCGSYEDGTWGNNSFQEYFAWIKITYDTGNWIPSLQKFQYCNLSNTVSDLPLDSANFVLHTSPTGIVLDSSNWLDLCSIAVSNGSAVKLYYSQANEYNDYLIIRIKVEAYTPYHEGTLKRTWSSLACKIDEVIT